MKIVLVSAYFYPESSGGTERYVYDLASGLQNAGHDVQVISSSANPAVFTYKNIAVTTLPDGPNNLEDFSKLVREIHPDVLHFQTLTPAFDIAHIRVAKAAGCKIVFTSHIAGNTCIRGSLMRFGHLPCDGKIRMNTCLACYINGKTKITAPGAQVLASAVRLFDRPKTLAHVVPAKKAQLQMLAELCDQITVFSFRQAETFTLNGFDPQKIRIVGHAWSAKSQPLSISPAATFPTYFRIGFAGRISPEKGLHVLIDAFLKLKRPGKELLIAGVPVREHDAYFKHLQEQTRNSTAVNWKLNQTPKEMRSFMQGIDVLCIPSLIFETGPYVLFESLLQGTPVIGSATGGMQDLAGQGLPVRLVPPDDPRALLNALEAWQPESFSSANKSPALADMVENILKLYTSDTPA